MEKNNPVILAYEIKKQGPGMALDTYNIAKKSKSLEWVHLNAESPDTRPWLEDHADHLDDIIVNALLAEETIPRILEFEQGTMIILRGVNLNDNSDPEDMISIRLWIDKQRIISFQRRNLRAVQDMRDKIEKGKGPKNAGDFVLMLCQRLFERMEPIFSNLNDHIDNLEEAILDNPDAKDRQKITVLRKQAITFRRYIAPQKDVMLYLSASNLSWLDNSHKRGLHEVSDRILRYVQDLDAIRERAQIIKDELANSLVDKMNKNSYILSLIAAIFLPLGFLTGLFGINVGGMPGVDNEGAFWILCWVCLGFFIFVTAVFRILRWL